MRRADPTQLSWASRSDFAFSVFKFPEVVGG